MDAAGVITARLANQHLVGNLLSEPAAVASAMVATQAQELPVSLWSLGQRAGASRAAVEKVLDAGEVVRTHVLRPTWHFVDPRDVAWLQALTGKRVKAATGAYAGRLGLDESAFAAANDLIVAALSGNQSLTRGDLRKRLAADGMALSAPMMAQVMLHAELDALVVSGASAGGRQTYALLAERAPVQVALSGDEALAELARRYFESHGPATVADCAWWSGLPKGQVRKGVAAYGGLDRVEVDHLEMWAAPGSTRPAPEGVPTAHFLQAYDELVVAYTESRHLANPAGWPIVLVNDDRVRNLLVVDGAVAGWWRTTGRPESLVEVHVLADLGTAQRSAVDQAAEDYARHVGNDLTFDFVAGAGTT